MIGAPGRRAVTRTSRAAATCRSRRAGSTPKPPRWGCSGGDIEPGVVYSTSCTDDPDSLELNIDAESFNGGFLEGFHRGQRFDERALRVSFTEPVRAFGFDTDELMGRTFKVRIIHTDDRIQLGSRSPPASPRSSSYGFVSGAADIKRARILGTGHRTFGFALDDLRFDPATWGDPPVSERPNPSRPVDQTTAIGRSPSTRAHRGKRDEQP